MEQLAAAGDPKARIWLAELEKAERLEAENRGAEQERAEPAKPGPAEPDVLELLRPIAEQAPNAKAPEAFARAEAAARARGDEPALRALQAVRPSTRRKHWRAAKSAQVLKRSRAQ